VAYEIAILNPRRSSKRSRKSGKRRSTKVAKARRNKKGRFVKASSAPKRHRKRAAKAAAPKRRRRKGGKRTPATGYVVGSARIRRRKLNPRRRHRSRRRHNPRFSVAGITSQLVPAAYGAAGAVALDVALGYIPLPAMFQTGYGKHGARIVGALGIGWLARKFLGSKGNAVAAGALTVAMYSLVKDVVVQFAPSVKGLGDYEEIAIDNTADQIGAYMDPAARLGAYLPDGSVAPGMGAYMGGPIDDSYDRDGAALMGMDY